MTALSSQLGYQIRIDQFEGPLALLLHLIRKNEMDIYDIQITGITKQYLEFIKRMRSLDLEVAGEFVAMAATLIHIKSRMLLPSYDEEGEEIQTEDPRKELVQKLLEYQKFQEASQRLYDRPLQGRDFWPKGLREKIEVNEDEEGILLESENALYSLIGVYRRAIRNMKKAVHKVAVKGQSIAERVLELRTILKIGRKTTLQELSREGEHSNNRLLMTFLSLLELGKMGFVSLYQADSYSDIHVDVRQEVDRDVVLRVEEYDSKGSEEVAESLMRDSEDTQYEEQIQQESDQMIAATDEEIAAEEARGLI